MKCSVLNGTPIERGHSLLSRVTVHWERAGGDCKSHRLKENVCKTVFQNNRAIVHVKLPWLWLSVQDLRRTKLVKTPAWVGRGSERPSLCRGVTGSFLQGMTLGTCARGWPYAHAHAGRHCVWIFKRKKRNWDRDVIAEVIWRMRKEGWEHECDQNTL